MESLASSALTPALASLLSGSHVHVHCRDGVPPTGRVLQQLAELSGLRVTVSDAAVITVCNLTNRTDFQW